MCHTKRAREGTRPLPYCAILGLSCALTLQCAKAPDVSLLSISPEYADFGVVGEGMSSEVILTVANRGGLPLVVSKIQSSCGCTVAAELPKTIAPHESAPVPLTFHARLGQSGEQSGRIQLCTKTPSKLHTVISYRALVEQFVKATPPAVDFGSVLKKCQPKSTVRVSTVDDSRLVIDEIKTPATCTARAVEVSAHEAILEVTLAPDLPVERFSDVIFIRVNHPKSTGLLVPVVANVLPNLVIEPRYSLDCGSVAPGATVTRHVRIQNEDAVDLSVFRVAVESLNSPLHPLDYTVLTELNEIAPGRLYDLSVTLRAGQIERPIYDRIVLCTNNPDDALHYIALRGEVIPPLDAGYNSSDH